MLRLLTLGSAIGVLLLVVTIQQSIVNNKNDVAAHGNDSEGWARLRLCQKNPALLRV